MAIRVTTANAIPDMPPWMLDQVAPIRNNEDGTPVTAATTIPVASEAASRSIAIAITTPCEGS